MYVPEFQVLYVSPGRGNPFTSTVGAYGRFFWLISDVLDEIVVQTIAAHPYGVVFLLHATWEEWFIDNISPKRPPY